jgi:hypothetical protein
MKSQGYFPDLTNDIVPTLQPSDTITTLGNVLADCFDIRAIVDDCKKVWLGVNVHVFLDNNCEGEIAINDRQYCINCDLTSDNIQAVLEDIINRANAFAENISDNIPWGNELIAIGQQPGSGVAQCFPIRLVLKGVHVHCNSALQQIASGTNLLSSLGVNPTSEINIFITGISGAGGYTNYWSNAIYTSALTWGGAATLWHEVAHTADVHHPWEEGVLTNLTDTWDPSYSWDDDCNPSTPPVIKYSCWDDHPKYPDGTNICPIDRCGNVHPCCGWGHQTTNFMAYSAWGVNGDVATFSKQQLILMLNTINEKFCNKVVAIDPECAPPSAVIYLPPLEGTGNDCSYCFQLGGSMNEDSYNVTFTEIQNGSSVQILNTGWINTAATSYCINLAPIKSGSNQLNGGFKAGHTYSIKLKVKNACGIESEQSRTFTLPGVKNCTEQPVGFEVSPNPASEYTNIKITTYKTSNITIAYSHVIYGLYGTQNLGLNAAGDIFLQPSITSWYPGLNFVHVVTDEGIYSHTIVKE